MLFLFHFLPILINCNKWRLMNDHIIYIFVFISSLYISMIDNHPFDQFIQMYNFSKKVVPYQYGRSCDYSFQKCFQHLFYNFNCFKHSTNDALDCLIHKFQSKKAAIKCKSSCFPGRHLPSKCHGREIWGHKVLLSYTSGIYFICDLDADTQDY
jgi:hypothetical protein